MNKTLQKIKYLLILAAIAATSAGCTKMTTAPVAPYTTALQAGTQKIFVQVVTTPQEMQQGLSGREKLGDNQGMLFNFGAGAGVTPQFWMKDMKFNLDLIWIKNNKIVSITKNAPKPEPGAKDSQLAVYSSPAPVDAVLEVNAGWTDRNAVKIGDGARVEN